MTGFRNFNLLEYIACFKNRATGARGGAGKNGPGVRLQFPALPPPPYQEKEKEPNELEEPPPEGDDPEKDDSATTSEKLQRVWRRNIAGVSYPFLLLGFPVHLLFGRPGEPKRTWSEWLWGIFLPDNLLKLILTVPSFCYALIVLLALANIVRKIFHTIFIVGVFNWDVLFNFTLLARTFPAVLPLGCVWMYGHTLRNLISSYDRYRDDYLQCVPEYVKKAQLASAPSVIWTLIGIYFIVLCTHVVPILTDSFVVNNYLGHWVDVMYSFVLPFYFVFVAGIRSQFELFNIHLRELVVENERPTLERLANLKALYKRITRQVIYVNDVFGLYLSWVIPAYAYTLGVHFFFVLLYLTGFVSLTTLVGYIELFDNSSPVVVRILFANLSVMLMYAGLVGYIMWTAIKANDESRYAQMLMLDYLSDRDRDPPALLVATDDVYKSARHLKFILQATEKQENPALLRLMVARYIPWVNTRLHSHDLHHVVVHGRFLKEIV